MCLDVRGALRNWSDRLMRGVFRDDDGRVLSSAEAREFLFDQVALGRKVIPTGPICEGFSYDTGCPGHPTPGDATAAAVEARA